ncbi:large conductance mechanosensitive channel protein MscL [Kaistella antarctica]|uniref:Large-conductance mechanosensitive channel n=1 Tax=Kaistella antarctica TaxID=266748 RepID=A0A3S4WUV5_9FLAO|nr:large conductance mechanosensitive channel protein MscL [Kaistella antarctica]KEY20225.1 mechanosensitive ion channel protein MscL [Kaistella antarctica]SEV92133.1 large conductance mechanosensitive channel [Kaistella antarctica]VEI01710.1 Large-conductance mechanosensitive channel [Kaistella antarctica]
MGIVQDFKEFALKGNVIDLAVAVIIGAAFGKIVSSLVEDVITPLLLNPALKAAGAENISKLAWNGVTYGNFLSAVISFLCIAIVLFIIIRAASKLKKPVPVVEVVAGPTQEELLAEIRDLLKNR